MIHLVAFSLFTHLRVRKQKKKKKCVHSMDLNGVVLDKTIFQNMYHRRKQVKQHCKDIRWVNDDRSFTFWWNIPLFCSPIQIRKTYHQTHIFKMPGCVRTCSTPSYPLNGLVSERRYFLMFISLWMYLSPVSIAYVKIQSVTCAVQLLCFSAYSNRGCTHKRPPPTPCIA